MNYKLAKQLKDAGFPQASNKGFYHCKGEEEPILINFIVLDEELAKNVKCLDPTLSELIEACGDRLMAFHKGIDKWLAQATPKENDLELTIGVSGKTPEEAVAKLYIKLNT